MTFPAAKFSSAEELISALDWWRDAGVSHLYADEPQDWLAGPEVKVQPAVASTPPSTPAFTAPPSPPCARIGGDPAMWPQDLAAFQAWWLAEPSLDDGHLARRVAPRGIAGADIMVMIDHPDTQDSDVLLSGPRGRLLNAILSALGVPTSAVYIASALPRHMPLPDWAELDAAGLGELARHHVALAAPKRLIGFGSHVSSLLGHDPAKSVQQSPQIWSLGASIPAIVAPELEILLARPMGKARLWQALLDWQAA